MIRLRHSVDDARRHPIRLREGLLFLHLDLRCIWYVHQQIALLEPCRGELRDADTLNDVAHQCPLLLFDLRQPFADGLALQFDAAELARAGSAVRPLTASACRCSSDCRLNVFA